MLVLENHALCQLLVRGKSKTTKNKVRNLPSGITKSNKFKHLEPKLLGLTYLSSKFRKLEPW